MNASEESVKRWVRRREIAREFVRMDMGDDGDFPDDAEVESVDGGYWVTGRVFVDADSVEHVLNLAESTKKGTS